MSHSTSLISGNSPTQIQTPKPGFDSWMLVTGLLLTGIGGGFLPWIWHKGIALQLTAPGLAEFIKFLPEIRNGTIPANRLYFLLPLFLSMLALPIFVENRRLFLPIWLRWILRLSVIPLALVSLSPVWTPTILRSPEFRLQTLLAATAVGLALIAPLLKGLPKNLLVILFSVGGAIALILPSRQFSLIQASIATAYHEPISLGWGWWLTVIGVTLSILGGLWGTKAFPRIKYTEKDNPTCR